MTHPATIPQPIAELGEPARMHRTDARYTPATGAVLALALIGSAAADGSGSLTQTS